MPENCINKDCCAIATEKSKYWIALVVIGGAVLLGVIVLALMAFAFGLGDVLTFFLILHNTGSLYFMIVGAVVLLVLGLHQLRIKQVFCGIN
jgi:hypothetical protein